MPLNLMSQLFGSKLGHKINTAFSAAATSALDAAEQDVLAKLGLPQTVEGAVKYIEVKVDAAIASETALTDLEKATLTNLVNQLAGPMES